MCICAALAVLGLRGMRQSAPTFTIVRDARFPKLANSLFALCEDMRLERICRSQRPGTGAVFAHRHRILGGYFQHKLRTHVSKGELADAVLLFIYGWFTGKSWQNG